MKNKIARISLLASSILAISGVTTFAVCSCSKTTDETVGQVIFKDIDSTTTSVTSLANASDKIKTITVPSSYNGKKVVSISKGAFKNCPNLETISLPFIGHNENATGVDGMFGYIFGDEMYEGGGSFTWQECEDNTNATIYGKYAIPTNLINVNVTNASRIPAGAFSNCKYIENIKINKADIKTIENKAFYFCSSINDFDFSFSSSLTTVEKSAFEKCYTLSSIAIPSTVKTVKESAFANCISASTITIPKSVTKVETNAFSNASGGVILVEASESAISGWDSNWTESDTPVVYDFSSSSSYKYVDDWFIIVCGTGNNKYGYLAQWMGSWQQSVINVPGKVTIDGTELPIKVIGAKCFLENIYIKTLTFEEGITSIYPNTFAGCTNLQYVNFPASLTDIRAEAFKNCTSLVGRYVDGQPVKGIDLLNTTSIRKQAFYGCTSLTDVTFDKVVTIGDEAFAHCHHLCPDNTEEETYALSIPASCTSLGEGAFKYCFKYVPEGYTANTYYPIVRFEKGLDGSAPKITTIPKSCFESCGVRVLKPTTGEDAGTIYNKYIRVSINLGGAHLVTIDDAAFKNCYMYHLTGARYTHLTRIGDYAFYYAQMTSDDSEGGKQDLQMDQEIEYIGEYAFAYCTTIWTLTFNTQIDSDIEGEPGTEMHYNSLKHLGQYAFYGCNNLNFTSVDLSPCVYLMNTVKTDTEEKYDAANTPRYAFSQCTNLQVVKLPGVKRTDPDTPACTSFTRLPERFCEGCTSLGKDASWTPMEIPSNITDIRVGAFNGCMYLKKCYIDGIISHYGSSIFYNNYNLETITKKDGSAVVFADDIASANIGSSIYYKCEKLTNPPIPVGTTGTYALNGSLFYANKALTTISIPAKVTSIGGSCFWECSSLGTVNFTDATSLSQISASAFENCISIQTLDLSKTVMSKIYDKAFAGCSSLTTIKLPNKSITFYSKPFDGLDSSLTIKFGKKSVVNYTGTKAWDYPETFKWAGNNTVVFTRTGESVADYYYICDTFGGTGIKWIYDATL